MKENLIVKIEPTSKIMDEGYTARLGTHFKIKERALQIETVHEGECFEIPIFDLIEFIGACAITSASA